MRLFLALILAATCAACSSGVAPSSITYGTAQYRAIGPQQTFGVRPEVKRAMHVPAGVVTCLTTAGAKVLVLAGETVDCLVETVTPPEVVPVQAYEPEALAAPSCASGACAAPPVQTPALPRGACLPPGK